MTAAGKREGWVDVEFGHELLLERRIHPAWVVERGEGRSQFEVTKIVVSSGKVGSAATCRKADR